MFNNTHHSEDVSLRAKTSARSVNEEYYNVIRTGMIEYWDKMAAPLYRSKVIVSLLRKYNVKSVLDLGCGCGQLLSRIYSNLCADGCGVAKTSGLRLAGVDLSRVQIETGRQNFPFIEWFVGDIEKPEGLPQELRNKFDAVVSSELIEHLENPSRVLDAARMMLADNGVLIISTQGGRIYETEKRIGHVRHFTKRDLKQLFIASGYTDVRVWSCGWPFHGISKIIANLDPDITMKKFSVGRYGAFENFACFATRIAYRFNLSFFGTQLFAVGKKNPAKA